jgi:DNA mismatch repair ATPase MutS
LNIDQKSILITGSNMSGKTTFIRTIALNSVLSQTIFTCFADEFITPFLKVFSSIRIDDNLVEGKSYFFEEVKTIDTLIQEISSSFQNLFILDEVFKGTNTVERVAAAKAVLHYLNKNKNIVLVSTHDLELSELLKEHYDLYHFEEQIVNEALSFDHLLKDGKLNTTNAIRLLELSGYPKEIIDEAKQLTK